MERQDRADARTGGRRAARGGPEGNRVTLRLILSDAPVRVAMIAAFVAMLGYGMIVPILPLFARSFHVGYGSVALLISAFAFTRLVLDVVCGPIVQRLGERISAATGVVVTGVASGLTAAAPTFPLAVVAWGVAGAGSALLFTALYSYLLKLVPHDRMGRTLSVFWGSLSVSWIAGAPIGGAIAHLGLTVPLWVYAGICFVSGWMFFRHTTDPGPRSPDVPGEGSGSRQKGSLRRMLGVPGFRALLFVNLGLFWLFAGGVNTIAPLFGQRALHLDALGISLALTAFAVTELVALYPAGAASDRYGRKWLLVWGLLGLALATGAIGFSSGPLAFGVVLAVGGVASGIAGVSPAAMLSDVTPEHQSAIAVAAYRFCGDLGYVLGPIVAGATAQVVGFRAAFIAAAIPTLLSALVLLRVPESKASSR